MSGNYLTEPLVFLIRTLFGLYELVVVLRLLFQYTRADFYNPLSQFVVRITNPPLRPLRKLIPGYRGIDFASVALLVALKTLEFMALLLVGGLGFAILGPLAWSVPALLSLLANIFLYAILIKVILSWVGPDTYNPAVSLLHSITEPLLSPARRWIPPISGLDLSPMVVMIAIVLAQMLLLPPLQAITGMPAALR